MNNTRANPNDYFKYCDKCKKSFLKTPEYFCNGSNTCLKCEGKKPFFRHEKENEKHKKYLRKRMKENVKNLSDEYVTNLILKKEKLSKKEKDKIKNNKELISLKKEQIKLHRIIKKWKNTKNT